MRTQLLYEGDSCEDAILGRTGLVSCMNGIFIRAGFWYGRDLCRARFF